jgi:hypothetical protein
MYIFILDFLYIDVIIFYYYISIYLIFFIYFSFFSLGVFLSFLAATPSSGGNPLIHFIGSHSIVFYFL